MRIAINKVHWPVTALGPGRRVGVWLQGCSIGCPGCLALDTWATPEQSWTTVESVVASIAGVLTDEADGVTISGGEPFDQPEALTELLGSLARVGERSRNTIDVLCYSGRPLGHLRREHPEILSRLDAVISDPFAAQKPTTRVWRGSANQRLTPLSDLGRERYEAHMYREEHHPEMQVQVDGRDVWMIGVPRAGDLARVSGALAANGVALGSESWRG